MITGKLLIQKFVNLIIIEILNTNQRNTTMKKILFAAAVVLFSMSLNAQTENDFLELARDVLKAEKKAVVAETMQLSEAESQPFWNLYSEYETALYTVQNKRIALIKDFSDNYESLTDEKANEIWMNFMKYKKENLKLKKRYYSKFKKVLSPGKAAQFMHVENKIETLIDAQLALEIPLIEIQ
jgi:vacuolar-type H+-ATPase subunit D/Vma8